MKVFSIYKPILILFTLHQVAVIEGFSNLPIRRHYHLKQGLKLAAADINLCFNVTIRRHYQLK